MEKKILIFVLFLVGFSTFGFSQNGYKEYKFGMSLEIISSMISGEKGSYAFDYAFSFIMYYLYSNELNNSIPSPLSETDDFSIYHSGQWWYKDNEVFAFYFDENKLVAVKIYFFFGSILSDLINKYGQKNSIIFSNGNYEGKTWIDNTNRFIVWQKEKDYDGRRTYETVTYVDEKWIKKLCDKRIQQFRNEIQENRSKLD
jgi:hypothetical protein